MRTPTGGREGSIMGTKKINLELTSAGGCTVKVNGTIEYTILDGFQKFTGTVTISGGAGCPNGSMTFMSHVAGGKESKGAKLSAMLDKSDISKVSRITWQGDERMVKLLNGSNVNRALRDTIRSVPFAS